MVSSIWDTQSTVYYQPIKWENLKREAGDPKMVSYMNNIVDYYYST